jgi:triphosphoribosyl-dephospho-CoA synthase
MGKVDSADVAGPPPDDLLAAMRLAADRDLVARQYAENFCQLFDLVVPAIEREVSAGLPLSDAIVRVYLQLMSQFPDSLIARKRGVEVANQAAGMASRALASGLPGDPAYEDALADLDFWLRADGHARNPGTTADLVAAGLFAALRDGIIKPPYKLAQ